MINKGINKVYLLGKRRRFLKFNPVFPSQIDLEVTNSCNLYCAICPQPTQKRKIEHMKLDIARKVIDEINKYGLKRMCLSVWGEPFLNRDFFEISRYAAAGRNIGHLYISSNGLLLDERIGEQLLTSGLDKVIISLDGAKKETYEKIRLGGDFDKVISNILNYLDLRRDHKKDKPAIAVQLIRMQETEGEVREFLKFWKGKVGPYDQVDIKEFIKWPHFKDHPQSPEYSNTRKRWIEFRSPCLTYLWSNLAVHSNGDITACCYDLNGDLVLGNIKENSIFDVWHGENCRLLRLKHLRADFSDIPICENCPITHRKITLRELSKALKNKFIWKKRSER